MATYRFVGTECEIGDHPKLKFLGDRIELSDSGIENAWEGKAQLITDANYKSCGFTSDEERNYRTPAQRHDAPEAFKAKFKKAFSLVGVKDAAEVTK
jgi:hypothetical protein